MFTVPPSFGQQRGVRGSTEPLVGEVVPAAEATGSPAPSSSSAVDPNVPNGAPPSTYAVVDFLDGQSGSLTRLAGLTLLRSVMIAPGLWVASKVSGVQLSFGQVLGFSLASSATITGGMVGWYALRRARGDRSA